MSDFITLLGEWLDLQSGTTITDSVRIDSFIAAAKQWDGTELDLVDHMAMVLTAHTKLRRPTIEKLCQNMKVKIGLGVIPKNHVEFVRAYCSKHSVKYTLDRQITMGGAEAADRDVFNELFLWTGEFGVFTGRDYLTSAWQKWKAEQERLNAKEFSERIAFDPDVPSDGWNLVVDALCADLGDAPLGLTKAEYLKLVKAVFLGSVWWVKRKQLNLPTIQHIMLYLRGKQGCGKTSFMRWFLGPVVDGMIQTDFGMFDHDEKQIIMKNTPVIFFDEVARADKADAAKVKNMMTSDTGMFRKLYGEASKGRMISTFFGAGNLDLTEVFHDPTGLRRFFQVECRKDLYTRLDELFEQVGPLDLWKSVNENEACPTETKEIIDLLMRVETTKRLMSPVEEWIKCEIDGGGWPDFLGIQDMFLNFSEWKEKLYPHDKTNLSSFSTQLGRILRDGDYDHEKRLDPSSRRATYRLGVHLETNNPDYVNRRNAVVVAISKSRADARRGYNQENIAKTA